MTRKANLCLVALVLVGLSLSLHENVPTYAQEANDSQESGGSA